MGRSAKTTGNDAIDRGAIPPFWLAGACFALAALFVLRSVSDFLQPDPSDPDSDGPTAVGEWSDERFRAFAWADERQVHTGDVTTLWLFVENRSSEPIEKLRIDELVAPGFGITGPCWPEPCELPRCEPLCRVGEAHTGGPPRGLPTTLGPHRSAGVRGELRARSVEGGESITIRLSWSPEPAKEPQKTVSQSLTVGPFRAVGAAFWVATAFRSIYETAADLGVPIALGLLAYLFQRLQSARERRHRTFDSMLPKAHENAVGYLLPMSLYAGLVAAQVERAKSETEAGLTDDQRFLARRRAFFYLIGLLKMNWNLLNKGGGYLLTDLDAESAVQACWNKMFRLATDKLGYARLYSLLDRVREDDSLVQFEGRFCPRNQKNRTALEMDKPLPEPSFSATFAETRSRFEEWAGADDFRDVVVLFRLYSHTVSHEVNLIYELWYQERDRSALEKLYQEWDKWDHKNAPTGHEFGGVAEALNTYLKKRPKPVQEGNPEGRAPTT